MCVGAYMSAPTFLCSIFLPVLVKAIPCSKDLGMCVGAYASLMVELMFGCLRLDYLPVLYFPASACLAIPCIGKDLECLLIENFLILRELHFVSKKSLGCEV